MAKVKKEYEVKPTLPINELRKSALDCLNKDCYERVGGVNCAEMIGKSTKQRRVRIVKLELNIKELLKIA